MREAIEFELERGGQVYYVYNRVESIEDRLAKLREIVPGVRVTVGHGQLDEEELSRRMHAFTRGDFDVLLATTIIENGIDIPNVNTMIVHRADRFGLAQLYQLRGRVGRSNQLAYCYFLVAEDRVLSEQARKRLAALREFSDLGAGFRIAARDLEIRGAGNLLGGEQSGHIGAVGIETYLKLLEETVRELRGEAVEEAPSVALDLPVQMSIPADYVDDANLRMELYRKIAEEPERGDARRARRPLRTAAAVGRDAGRGGGAQAAGRVAARAVDLGEGGRAGDPAAPRRAGRRRAADRDGLDDARRELQPDRRAHPAGRRRPAARRHGAADAGDAGRNDVRPSHGVASAGAVLLAAACQRSAPPAPDAVARLGDAEVRYAEFERYVARSAGDAGDVGLGSDVLSALFDQFLDERLLARLAADRGLVPAGGRRIRARRSTRCSPTACSGSPAPPRSPSTTAGTRRSSRGRSG